MGINTFQMEIRKRFHQQRREALVLGRDDPREGCSISPGLLSNVWCCTVPETEDVDGRKHTVLLRGRCGDGNPGTPLGVYTERPHAHCCTYDKSKGTREIRKGNVYFLAFEYALHPVESQINALVKSSRRGRVAPPHHGAVGPERGTARGTGNVGKLSRGPRGGFCLNQREVYTRLFLSFLLSLTRCLRFMAPVMSGAASTFSLPVLSLMESSCRVLTPAGYSLFKGGSSSCIDTAESCCPRAF